MKHFLFDAFGTLFRADAEHLRITHDPMEPTGQILETYRRRLLELTWVTRLSGTFIPFDELAKSAAGHALSTHGIRDPKMEQSLEGIYGDPLPFDDVEPAFREARKKGAKLYILSNGTINMLDKAVRKCRWEAHFSGIFSVEKVRSYKPDPQIYHTACASFGVPAEDTLFISSNDWDVFGATRAGLKAVWLDRKNLGSYTYPGAGPFRIIKKLDALVEYC